MGKKWGSNEDIRVGGIFRFRCDSFHMLYSGRSEHYQVVALRGKTQVVLRAVQSETYTQEGISEGGPMHYYRRRTRPLLGQFMVREEMWEIRAVGKGGKCIEISSGGGDGVGPDGPVAGRQAPAP